MVEAQCLCRSAWRKSDKSNKKRGSFNRIRNSNTASISLFCFFCWETLILSFKHFYAFVGPWNPTKKGWKNHGIFQRGRHQRPRHLDQWSHGSLVQKCTAPVGGSTSRCSFMCEKPRNSRCTKNTRCTFTSICEKFTNLEKVLWVPGNIEILTLTARPSSVNAKIPRYGIPSQC